MLHKVQQQRFILILALYILRENGFPKPRKRQVLNLIRFRNLMQVYEEDEEFRGREEIWENDIAWKRKDLFEEGLISSPDHGKWALTLRGLKYVEDRKPLWKKFEQEEEITKLLEELPYLTEDTVDWMLKIALDKPLNLSEKEADGSTEKE